MPKGFQPVDYDGYFFDFDGVLADSVDVKTQAFVNLFQPFGQEIQSKVKAHHLANGGMTRRDKFRYYYDKYLHHPLSDQDLDHLCERFASMVVDNVVAAPEIEGVGAFLSLCRERGPCFVVSATPQDEIRRIIFRRGMHGQFLSVLGAPATKKENLERSLSRYGLDAGRCVFFGDATSDWHAAVACGVFFVGILPGPEAPLLSDAPDILWYRNFRELLAD